MTHSSVRALAAIICFSALLYAQQPSAADKRQSLEARIRDLYDTGHWSEAAELAAAVPVPSATITLYRGLALARLNRLGQSQEVFDRGARLFPRDKRFPLEMAGLDYRQKQFGAAKRFLHRALDIDPSDRYGNDFLATLYLLDRNLPAALKYWNRIQKPLIQNVVFSPMPPLNPVLKERAFDISGGQVFTLDRLARLEGNLDRLDVLDNVQFDLIPDQSDRFNLVIRSVPVGQPLKGWKGFLPALRGLPYQEINLDFYNIHRNAMNFTSLWRWDPNKRRIFLNLAAPWRLNPRTEYHYFVDVRDEVWDLRGTYSGSPIKLNGLLVRTAATGLDFATAITPRLQWTVGGRVSWRGIKYGDQSPVLSSGWLAEIRNQFDYRLWSWPDHRLIVDSRGLLRAGRVFSTADSRLVAVQGSLTASWYPQATGEKYQLATHFEAGRIFGNAPLDQLYMLGMERDNPYGLWLRGVAGTSDGRKGSAPMGREVALSQTDFKRRLFELPLIRMDAGPFFDVGWTGDPSSLFGSREWLYDAGVQAQISVTGNVKVTLIYGHNFRDGRNLFYSATSR